jgi:hypothetical protein
MGTIEEWGKSILQGFLGNLLWVIVIGAGVMAMTFFRIAEWPWVSAILYGLITLACLLIIRLCLVSRKDGATSEQKLPYGLMFVLVLLVLGTVIFDYQDRRRLTDPFRVEVRTSCVSDSGPLTLYMVTYPSVFGQTASPILYLAYIQIVNLQGVPSTMNDFEVAVSKEPEGPWEDLMQIPLVGTTLYALGSAASRPVRMSMGQGLYRFSPRPAEEMRAASLLSAEPILESELGKPIPPYSPVHGWVAFDSWRHVGLTPGRIYFRVTLRDAANKGGQYVVPLLVGNQISPSALNTGSFVVTGMSADLSNYYVKYYSDPFPSPDHWNNKK